MKSATSDWRIWAAVAAGVAVAVSVAISQWLRGPDDPSEIERRRRAHLNQVGRIVEGHVIELVQVAARTGETQSASWLARRHRNKTVNGHRNLVCYSYAISGVSYETAQDVTGLEERACLDRLAAGQPASIKYDPANPSDSILVADDWSGVR